MLSKSRLRKMEIKTKKKYENRKKIIKNKGE